MGIILTRELIVLTGMNTSAAYSFDSILSIIYSPTTYQIQKKLMVAFTCYICVHVSALFTNEFPYLFLYLNMQVYSPNCPDNISILYIVNGMTHRSCKFLQIEVKGDSCIPRRKSEAGKTNQDLVS